MSVQAQNDSELTAPEVLKTLLDGENLGVKNGENGCFWQNRHENLLDLLQQGKIGFEVAAAWGVTPVMWQDYLGRSPSQVQASDPNPPNTYLGGAKPADGLELHKFS